MPRQHQRPPWPATTNNPAPFSPEMVLVVHPDSPRLDAPFQARARAGWIGQYVSQFVTTLFSMEMVYGWHPDSPRLPMLDHRGASLSQTTHVPVAFSTEMAQGWHADSPRLSFAGKPGLSLSQTTHTSAPISIEMLAGSHPDAARFPFVAKLGVQTSQTTHVPAPITADMLTGWHPDRPRFSFAKIGQTLSQTTHTPAPFSPEMVTGWHPDRPRTWIAFPSGQQLSQLTVTIAPTVFPRLVMYLASQSNHLTRVASRTSTVMIAAATSATTTRFAKNAVEPAGASATNSIPRKASE